MKAKTTIITLFLFILSIKASSYDGESRFRPFSPDGIPFCVAGKPWDIEGRGHHRAVVEVKDNMADAVTVTLPWRRADLRQNTKKIVVVDASTDKEIKNVSVVSLTAEKGTVVFEPVNGQKTYFIYYLACHLRKGAGDARYGEPWNDYLSPEYDASAE